MAESLRDLVVSLSLDGDNFSKNLTAINKQIREAESEFSAASAGVDGFENSLEGSRAKVDALTKKYELQARAVEQYQKALKSSEDKLSASAAKQEQLNKALAEAKAEYTAVAEAEGADSDAARALADRIKTLEGQLAANAKTMKNQANAVTDNSTKLHNAEAAMKSTESELKKTTAELKAAESGWTRAGQALQNYSDRLKSIGNGMSTVGRSMSTYVTAPIVALGTACVASFNSVDEGMDIIVTKTGATGEALASMQDSMKNVFGSLAVDADEAGTAIGEVNTRFGMMGDELEKTSALFLEFSKISGSDVNGAIDDVDSIMEKFGVDASRVNEVLGLVTKVGQSTGITMESLTGSLKTNGASLKEMGLDLESSIMLMAQFEQNGVDASTALMGIKTAVKNSAKDGQDAQSALRDTMAAIKDATTETEALSLAIELFGTRGAAEMTDAIRSGRFDIDQLSVSMSQYATLVEETYNATLDLPDQAKVAFNNLKMAGASLADTAMTSLVPVLTQIIDGIKDMVVYIGEMDQATVLTIVKIAAISAAAGPLVSLMGKIVTGTGAVVGALGKFSAAVGAAGGGWSGFMSVVGKSPVTWIALGAAIGVAAYKLTDYLSGAKAAREAMESLNKTADEWTNNAASTFYSQSQGLTRFGMSAQQFAGDVESAHKWLSRLTAEWGDDYQESDETVNAYVESWKKASKATTDALTEIADSAAENGYDALYTQTKGYISEIDAIDAEVEALLKKRQEYELSDQDIADLQRLIDRRQEIEVEYKISKVETGGFAELDAAIDAAKARAEASGQQLGMDFYQDTMVAAAEGMKAVNQQIDNEYNERYKTIQLIQNETEREKERAELDLWYQSERQTAADRYMDTLSKYVSEVWNNSDYQEVYGQMGELLGLIDQYTTTRDATGIAEFAKTLDPDKITEYYGVLTQITELESKGYSMETIGEKLGMTPDDIEQIRNSFGQLQFIMDTLGSFSGDTGLQPLRDIFGDLSEEVIKIATDLDMTGAAAAWKKFAENPGASILAEMDGSNLPEKVEIPAIVDADGNLTNPPTAQTVTAYVDANGVVHNLPTTHDVTATVDANGKLTNPPGEQSVSAVVDANGEIINVPENGGTVDVTLNSDGTVTGLPQNENITAIVTSDGTIYNLVTSVPVDVTLNSLAELQVARWKALNGPKVKLTADVTPTTVSDAFGHAYFDDLTKLFNDGKAKFYDASGATIEVTPEVLKALTKDALVVGMSEDGTYHIVVTPEWEGKTVEEAEEAMEELFSEKGASSNAYNLFGGTTYQEAIDKILEAYEGAEKTMEKAKGNGLAEFFGLDKFSPDTAEYIDGMLKDAAEVEVANSFLTMINALQSGEAMTDDGVANFEKFISLVEYMNKYSDIGGRNGVNLGFMATLINGLNQMGLVMDQKDIPGYLRDLVTTSTPTPEQTRARQVTAEDTANYILQMKSLAMAYEDGNRVMGEFNPKGAVMMGEAAEGFDKLLGEGGLQDAVNQMTALVAAGGELSPDDLNLLAAYADAMTALGRDIPESVSQALEGADVASLGFNMAAGIASGILNGEGEVVAAMRKVATDALAAAREALDIHSPSRVFRDQIGAMMMKGLGQGIVDETESQAAIIRNAANYLAGEARGAFSKQTYTIDSSVTLTGNTFSIRSDEDIGALAREIAALTQRQQTGRGLRR